MKTIHQLVTDRNLAQLQQDLPGKFAALITLDITGQTPMHRAVISYSDSYNSNSKEIIQLLLNTEQGKLSLSIKTSKRSPNYTPIEMAIEKTPNNQSIRFISPYLTIDQLQNAILFACNHKKYDAIKYILDHIKIITESVLQQIIELQDKDALEKIWA